MIKFNFDQMQIDEIGQILASENGRGRKVVIRDVKSMKKQVLEVFISYRYKKGALDDKGVVDNIAKNDKGYKMSNRFIVWSADRQGNLREWGDVVKAAKNYAEKMHKAKIMETSDETKGAPVQEAVDHFR